MSNLARNIVVIFCACAVCVLGIAASPERSAAEIYSWTDAFGVTHYVDREDKIPARYREKASKKNVQPLETFDGMRSGGAVSSGSARSSSSGSKKTSSASRSTGASVLKDKNGKTKEYWRGELGKWQSKKYLAQKQITELEPQVIAARSRNNFILANEYLEKIGVARAEIETCDRMIKIEIPERGRQAGAPASWFD